MKIPAQNSTYPVNLLQGLLGKLLNERLLPLENKTHEEMVELKNIKESYNQMITKLSPLSNLLHETKLRPKVFVIKKKVIGSKSNSPTPALNQGSKVIHTKARPTIKPPVSQDKFRKTSAKHDIKLSDHSLTRAPTMKSYTPDRYKKIDKSPSHLNVTNRIINPKKNTRNIHKLLNKTCTGTTSITTTPATTPNRSGKRELGGGGPNQKEEIHRKISNYFGNLLMKSHNDHDEMLTQDKFLLSDIRLSRIETPFMMNNNSTTKNNQKITSSLMSNNALGIGEQLETNWDMIGNYISTKEMIKMTLVNKQFGVNAVNVSIERIEKDIESLEKEVTEVKTLYAIDIPFESYVPFKLDKTTQRAVNCLNEAKMDKIFMYDDQSIPSNDIMSVYSLYFTIIKKKVTSIERSKEDFWRETCEHFINRGDMNLGQFIEEEMKQSKFDDEVIYSLYQFIIKDHKKKMTPNHYQNICSTTALFVFVIKDVMEHLGLGKNMINDKNKWYRILNARLYILNKILAKLNNINERYLN